MDSALIGTICGFAGTMTGAALGYFGPLRLERRRQESVREAATESQIALDLDRYVRARVVADLWLDLLRRALEDSLMQRLDPAQFDTESTDHSKELRLRTAELTHIGIATVRSGTLFNLLRNATAMIKEFDILPIEEKRQNEIGIREIIMRCQLERGQWAELMLEHVRHRTGRDLALIDY
ncbi:hypothetical protein ACFWXO_20205 [Kitasatospora sp. NPDC059088]|uniref:hypothetical protein n=1 Tax=Kitasatospora sp. NPDC059088 TaxID=3346722 RepID=UPI0036B340DE